MGPKGASRSNQARAAQGLQSRVGSVCIKTVKSVKITTRMLHYYKLIWPEGASRPGQALSAQGLQSHVDYV